MYAFNSYNLLFIVSNVLDAPEEFGLASSLQVAMVYGQVVII